MAFEGVAQYFPNMSSILGTVNLMVLLVVGLILILTFGGLIAWFFITKLLYNKKIVFFEKVGSYFEPVKKDSARILKWGKSGDSCFFTRKTKLFLPTPTLQMGRNVYWYAKRQDGEYINFKMRDLDTLSKEMDIHFLDKEMRYARVSLHKNIEERFKKITFWDKYGGFIAYTILIMVICFGMWLLLDKMNKISDSTAGTISASEKVIDKVNNVLTALDNICPKTSGAIPTPTGAGG